MAAPKSKKNGHASNGRSWGNFDPPFGAKGLRVGIYARVSTSQQQSIPMQIHALREHAGHRGWNVVMVVQEKQSTMTFNERSERQKILQAARRRELDAVMVWKLDRWGRSVLDLVLTLKELQELGVAFVSLTEGFDLTTPSGRAMAGMLAVFAEFEREIRRERQAAGIARARREGKHLGRPKKIWHRTERRAVELARAGEKVGSIAHTLKIGRSSVRRILAKNGPL